MARLEPIAKPYSLDAEAALKLMPADLALFRTVAHNPRVLTRWAGGGLLDKGSITLRQREIIILRVTAKLGAEYEWGVHALYFASKAGFTAAELAATLHGGAEDWPQPDEAVLVKLADALRERATVDDALWTEATAQFDSAQMVEIITLVGFYHLVAFTVNATGVAFEPKAPRFPAHG